MSANSGGVKEIIILIFLLMFTFPSLLKAISWSQNSINNPNSINELPNIILENTLPWWLDIFVWLAGFGALGALLIIGFIYFLCWAKQL